MTTHATVAFVGVSAFIVTLTECLGHRRKLHCRLFCGGATFICLIALGVIPCPPKHAHKEASPTLEARPDIDHTEKLMLAHYRRIRQERTLTDAYRP